MMESETTTEDNRLCPDGTVCPTIANFVVLGLYCVFAAVFVTWRTKRRYQLTSWGFVESGVKLLKEFRWSASDPQSGRYAQEYAEVCQRYCEASTLTIFLIHVAISTGMLIIAMPMATRFWASCWTVFGLWLMLLVAVPRLHQIKGVPFGYLVTFAVIFMHQAALDGKRKEGILLSNAPIMMGLIVLAPTAGATPTSAALYSCLGSLSYSMFVSYMYDHSLGYLQVSMSTSMFVVWQHTMGLFLCSWGCLCNIILMAYSVQVSVERKATLAECEAVSGLLDIVCDAVVELDETGTIISPSPNLSNLLLLSGAPSLQGRQLQQLLHGDKDKRIFREFLSEEKKARKAVALHLDMQDSWGNPVRMELYSVTFSGAKSKAKYLVGIKEDRDFARPTDGDDVSVMPSSDSKLPPPSSSGQAEWGDESESVVSRVEERFFEGTMPTSSRALDASLVQVMHTWSLGCGSRVAGACCSYHAAIGTMAFRANKLGKGRCLRDFKFFDGAQCGQCGIRYHLDERGGGCIMCEIVERRSPRIAERGPKRGRPASHWHGQPQATTAQNLGTAVPNHAEQNLGEAAVHAGAEGPLAQKGHGRSRELPRGQVCGQAQRRHMAL